MVPAKAQRRKERPSVMVGQFFSTPESPGAREGPRPSQSSFASLRLRGKSVAKRLPAVLIPLLIFGCAYASAQSRRPMTPADILRVANVGDAQISPNGDWIVYTVSTVDGDDTLSTLWLVRAGI